MIDVYAWGTTNGLRATLAMAECGLAHRVIPVDIGRKQHKAAEYLSLNPAGQIPTIVDHGAPQAPRGLTQSAAIVLYACEKAGRHIPADRPTYYTALQWAMQAATDIGGASAGLQQVAVVAPEKVRSTVDLFEQRFMRYFGYVDQQLKDREFLAGDFSFADMMVYPNYVLRRPLIERLGELPRLGAWAARMAQRPGVHAGMQLAEA